jgi:hypothetical protein
MDPEAYRRPHSNYHKGSPKSSKFHVYKPPVFLVPPVAQVHVKESTTIDETNWNKSLTMKELM